MKASVSILVSSFDGYYDLWSPLEKSYSKYWKDCPYEIFISTNFIKDGFTKFLPIPTGKDKTWSDMLIKTLDKIETEYILLTFDDLFFKDKIDTNKVVKHINYALSMNANYYQLYPSISKKKKMNGDFSEKIKNTNYRNGTVWSLWKKETLLELLDEKENAWEFEVNGNFRSKSYDKFYSTNKTIIPYYNAVVKGVWVRDVYFKLKKDKIVIGSGGRKKMNYFVYLIYKTKLKIFNLYRRLSFKYYCF